MLYKTLALTIFGLIISSYSLYLEQRMAKTALYHPFCDISDKISCSRALTSEYARPFGISNAALGVLFYATLILFNILGFYSYIHILSWVALLASAFLAYTLYFKIQTVCILCTAIYIINIALCVTSYLKL